MTAATDDAQPLDDRLARNNAFVLAGAQAVGGAAAPIVISIGGLAGYYLLGTDKSLATVPVTTFVVGMALAAVPAALLMQRIGRRPGFQLGGVCTMIGGALSAWALMTGTFWLLCVGTAFTGAGFAFVQQYRFAAADTATKAFRPKAISWVLVGGVAAGVIGPQLVIFSKDALAPIPFAGAFIGQILLAALVILVLSRLRIPVPVRRADETSGRPLREIAAQPRFIVAVVCAIVSYGLMTFVMTATPLAMVACDHPESAALLGIQWHVIAMFGPSFFTGSLIVRYGKESVIAAGLGLLIASSLIALSGITIAHFWVALILLGVGWNFGFIGATAMVTDTYRSQERGKVQALNDFLVFGFQASGSLLSGAILNAYGWEGVNLLVLPFAMVGLGMLAWLSLSGRGRAAA